MSEIFNTAATVATPLALLGVIVVAGMFTLHRYWLNQERMVKSLPEDSRAVFFDNWLQKAGYDVKNLTREQKFDIAARLIDQRHQRLMLFGLMGLFITMILSCAGLVGYLFGPLTSGPKGQEDNNVALTLALFTRGTFVALGFAILVLGALSTLHRRFAADYGVIRLALVVLGGAIVLTGILKPFTFKSGNTMLTMSPIKIEQMIKEEEDRLASINADLSRLESRWVGTVCSAAPPNSAINPMIGSWVLQHQQLRLQAGDLAENQFKCKLRIRDLKRDLEKARKQEAAR